MVGKQEKDLTEEIEIDEGGSLGPGMHGPLFLEAKNNIEKRVSFLAKGRDIGVPQMSHFPLNFNPDGLA